MDHMPQSPVGQLPPLQFALDEANERYAAADARLLKAGTDGRADEMEFATIDKQRAGEDRYRLRNEASEFLLALIRITVEERQAQLSAALEGLPFVQELADAIVRKGVA